MERNFSLYQILSGFIIVILAIFLLAQSKAQLKNEGELKSKQEVTFYALSDTHYGASKEPNKKVEWINRLPGTKYPKIAGGGIVNKPRGIIMAGDLINDGAREEIYQKQWENFVNDFGVGGEGHCNFPVFECVGNHDLNNSRFVFNKIKERNQKRLALGYINHISENGYHYSWDWGGIHFVNVNLFPGNVWQGESDAYGREHDPLFSRDFLEKDLRENVGNRGRPVIVVHHYRPIDENWWTYEAADKYYRILQDYNIVLIMCGHQGGGLNNSWRGINWASSNGELEVFHIADNTLTGLIRRESEWGEFLKKPVFYSYETSPFPAVVNNGEWVTNISSECATLSGKILYEAMSPTKAEIYWGEVDGRDNPNAWEHNLQVGVKAVGSIFNARIKGLHPWKDYYYRVKVTNKKGEAWSATSIHFRTCGILPNGWNEQFIGYSQRPWNGAHYINGSFIVCASGRDIGERGESIDNFEFAFKPVEDNVEFQARIDKMEGSTRYPKAGIMLRETCESNSPHVALLYNKNEEGVQLYARTEACGVTAINPVNKITLPVWVKLVRQHNIFRGYVSSDGETWKQIDEPLQVQMLPKIHAGLAVTAGNRDGSAQQTCVFTKVFIK